MGVLETVGVTLVPIVPHSCEGRNPSIKQPLTTEVHRFLLLGTM